MAHTACCSLPEFALQVLLRREPERRLRPCVALADDAPQAPVIGCNTAAAELGVKTGMRYAAVLELAPQVYAASVSQTELQRQQQRVIASLYTVSDEVLYKPDEPGVLWVNAAGFSLLHESLRAWAEELNAEIARLGFTSRIVVGFTRFGSYLVSTAARSPALELLQSAGHERRRVGDVPLHGIVTAERPRRRLARLGIETVGALLRLPRSEIRSRLGTEVELIYRRARGECELPARKAVVPAPLVAARRPLQPLGTREQILLELQRLLETSLLKRLARGERISELAVHLLLDDHSERRERIRPAYPTEQVEVLMRLLRLRFEHVALERPVSELRLEAQILEAAAEQAQLFREAGPERSAQQTSEAFAVLQASLGEEAVRHPELIPHHLPERRVRWVRGGPSRGEPPDHPPESGAAGAQMVRRAFVTPQPLSEHAARAGTLVGPYLLSCDWWQRPSRRLYYYLLPRGPDASSSPVALWVYYDLNRGCWMAQGTV